MQLREEANIDKSGYHLPDIARPLITDTRGKMQYYERREEMGYTNGLMRKVSLNLSNGCIPTSNDMNKLHFINMTTGSVQREGTNRHRTYLNAKGL